MKLLRTIQEQDCQQQFIAEIILITLQYFCEYTFSRGKVQHNRK